MTNAAPGLGWPEDAEDADNASAVDATDRQLASHPMPPDSEISGALPDRYARRAARIGLGWPLWSRPAAAATAPASLSPVHAGPETSGPVLAERVLPEPVLPGPASPRTELPAPVLPGPASPAPAMPGPGSPGPALPGGGPEPYPAVPDGGADLADASDQGRPGGQLGLGSVSAAPTGDAAGATPDRIRQALAAVSRETVSAAAVGLTRTATAGYESEDAVAIPA